MGTTSVRWALLLLLTIGCAPRADADRGQTPDDPAAQGPTASPRALIAPPAVGQTCPAGAYRHRGPDFCVVPPAAAGKVEPRPFESGVEIGGLFISWIPKSDPRAASWRKPARGPERRGPFEVWRTEPLPSGAHHVVFDATQSETDYLFHVPSVGGVAVVEGREHLIRCAGLVHLEAGEEGEARAAWAREAALVDACKSLRVE